MAALNVLIAAHSEAEADAVYAVVFNAVPGLKIAGAIWQAEQVAAHAASVGATAVLLPTSFPVLPDVGVPQLRYTTPAEALAALRAYQTPATPPPAPNPPPVVQRTPAPPPVAQPPAPRLNLPRRGPMLRLGLWGAHGGVGVTTAIAVLARDLVKNGARVIVFDAPRRGDVALYLDGTPSDQQQTLQGITVQPGAPTEELAAPYTAILIDGGRERSSFNARWVQVTAPLKEHELLALVEGR